MRRFAIPAVAAGLLLATSALAAPNGRPMLLAADEHRDAARPEEHRTTAAPREDEHRSTEHAMTHHRTTRVHRTHATGATEEHRDSTTTRSRDTETGREHATGAHNFNKSNYQRNVTATHRYHAGAYRQPQGYYYRRWTFGEVLPRLFWAQDYWLGDYVTYGLPAPPFGYVWVRYGDDALLIDTDTGEILQVDYGVFY